MSCKHAAWPLLVILAGCAPKAPSPPVHLAILRFENLSPDASSAWMGRALSEIVASELPSSMVIPSVRIHALDRTLGVRPVSAPGISTERSAALLEGATRIGYGEYTIRAGRIEARLSLEDPQTGRITSVFTATAGDVVTAASELAQHLSPAATAYDTRNAEAVRHYILGLEAGTLPVKEQEASAAIAADPNFGQAYGELSEARLQQHDRDGALAALNQGILRGSEISSTQRARLQLQASGLRNDFQARQMALAEIAKASPGDADSWNTLGQTAYARRDFKQAVEAYQKVLQLRSGDLNALNQLGYAQASDGDFEGSLRTFRRYQTLRPNDANPLDSTGDVNLMYGRLHEAEDLYLQADKKDRKFLAGGDLLKAAMARLMAGDLAGASTLAQQFADARTALHDPGVPAFQAEWLWISGNRKAAMRQLQTLDVPSKDLTAKANSDLAVWSLLQGDRAGAAQFALKAAASATQVTVLDAVMARFLSQPSAAATEWAARADQLFRNVPQTEVKDLALSYALLLDRHFAEASVVLRRLYSAPSAEPGVPILLAWSLVETGHTEEAVPLLRFNPVPQPNGISTYMGLYFPRVYELRARLADKAARQEEAVANRKLLQALAPGGLR